MTHGPQTANAERISSETTLPAEERATLKMRQLLALVALCLGYFMVILGKCGHADCAFLLGSLISTVYVRNQGNTENTSN